MEQTWIIIHIIEDELLPNRGGDGCIIGLKQRPKYLHHSREDAEREALRLHKQHGREGGHFVIYESVAFTKARQAFDAFAEHVIALEPLPAAAPVIPERPRRRIVRRRFA